MSPQESHLISPSLRILICKIGVSDNMKWMCRNVLGQQTGGGDYLWPGCPSVKLYNLTSLEAGFSYESEGGLAVLLPLEGVTKECFWTSQTQTTHCQIEQLFLEHCWHDGLEGIIPAVKPPCLRVSLICPCPSLVVCPCLVRPENSATGHNPTGPWVPPLHQAGHVLRMDNQGVAGSG